MLKIEMEPYITIRGRGLKNLMYPCMGVRGVKNCQNHPYLINEQPLIGILKHTVYQQKLTFCEITYQKPLCTHIKSDIFKHFLYHIIGCRVNGGHYANDFLQYMMKFQLQNNLLIGHILIISSISHHWYFLTSNGNLLK